MKRQKLIAFAFLMTLLLTPAIYGADASTDADMASDFEGGPLPQLNGAWIVQVASTATPSFTALQTFDKGGTMNETSDLLAQGGEGPGHGGWVRTSDGFTVTFELFIFNPDGTAAGRIRVRENIKLSDTDHFTGFSVADLILPDGTLIENIDNGPIQGERIRVQPVRAEEYLSQPTATTALWRNR